MLGQNKQPISLGDSVINQPGPDWQFIGNEIHQKLNSAPGVVVWGDNLYGAIVYEGTFQCSDSGDRDWIGSVFSFQVKRKLIELQICFIFFRTALISTYFMVTLMRKVQTGNSRG